MCRAALEALLTSEPSKTTKVMAIFDNEETGSQTKQGAGSPFLASVLRRMATAQSGSDEAFFQAVERGFMISADNAHAWHPNYPEKCDPTNRPKVNGGLLIKRHENYTTDGFSAGVLKDILNQAGVKYQEFAARSDMRNGSTLGKISLSHVSVPSVDIGMAQLAMHSANELCGAKDIDTMIEGMKSFYGADICFSL